MFTGLGTCGTHAVEIVGHVIDVTQRDAESGSYAISIGDCASILDDCHVGDSIAVNGRLCTDPGVCLTVTHFDAHAGWFRVDVAPETLFRTNLGALKVGDGVNCERAMAPHTRFGGHIVQGHVDTIARLIAVESNESALTLTLRLAYDPPKAGQQTLPLPSTLSPYLVPKGFVTLDGTSLTLIDVSPPNGGTLATPDSAIPEQETVDFSIMLIPHTQAHVALPSKAVGDAVNVEFDMVGKYVYRSLLGQFQRLDAAEGSGGVLSSTMLDRVVQRALHRIS